MPGLVRVIPLTRRLLPTVAVPVAPLPAPFTLTNVTVGTGVVATQEPPLVTRTEPTPTGCIALTTAVARVPVSWGVLTLMVGGMV